MKNQICTILGGGGFIGKYLVRNLAKKNYRCFISTRKPFQKGYLKTQATPGAIELIDWNSNNFSELKEAIKNSDIVINLIGILYETRKQKFYNIHSGIPEAVSKICSESDVKKFVAKRRSEFCNWALRSRARTGTRDAASSSWTKSPC